MSSVTHFTVTILSPLKIEWEGDAIALQAENSEGPFSIIPDHARFMTLLTNTPITITTTAQETVSYTFPQAVLFVDDNQARIYVQTETTPTFS